MTKDETIAILEVQIRRMMEVQKDRMKVFKSMKKQRDNAIKIVAERFG